MQFLTHFVSFDIPEWLLLEQVGDCEQLSSLGGSEKWKDFSKGKYYLDFVNKFLVRIAIANKLDIA